jgi:hypothetical protein
MAPGAVQPRALVAPVLALTEAPVLALTEASVLEALAPRAWGLREVPV